MLLLLCESPGDWRFAAAHSKQIVACAAVCLQLWLRSILAGPVWSAGTACCLWLVCQIMLYAVSRCACVHHARHKWADCSVTRGCINILQSKRKSLSCGDVQSDALSACLIPEGRCCPRVLANPETRASPGLCHSSLRALSDSNCICEYLTISVQ